MILDGKKIAAEIRGEVREQIGRLRAEGKRAPKLAIILVGHDAASEIYVANKMKACMEVGMEVEKIAIADSITEQALLDEIARLNGDETIDGFIVQLPVPDHLSEDTLLRAIDKRKDVDSLATPRGIRELLHRYHVRTEKPRVVVIGWSNSEGDLNAALPENATVTICHADTQDLGALCRTADMIIAAAGHPRMITADMVREGAVVIDLGFNRIDGQLVGDVDYKGVAPKCSFITPMPGGVGPMTIVSLLQNTLQAYNEYSR